MPAKTAKKTSKPKASAKATKSAKPVAKPKKADAKKVEDMAITLPEVADISAATALHEEVLKAFDAKAKSINFVAKEVEKITTPCAQIIVAASKYCADNGIDFAIKDPSERFDASMELLGIDYKELISSGE
jgi:anti-anti-sigma regulatory factor